MKQYVILSHQRWSSRPSRIQQLSSRLNEAEILFFQPADRREPPVSGKQVRPNITLYTLPPERPLSRRVSLLERGCVRQQAAFLSRQLEQHGFDRPVLWLTHPDQLLFLDRLRFRALIYDCDRFWPAALENRESELACAADLIFAASPQLKRRLSPCSANVALLPNGVNYPMFSRTDCPLPAELSGLSGPLLGWVGTIDEELDLSPVRAAAERHPEWNLLLIGPVRDCPSVRQLSRFPNVHLLGPRSIADLPEYLSHCRVLLNLRCREDADSDVIPIRIYEYLSTGLPIVSLLLPDEVEAFPDVIYSAADPSDFVRLCENALEEDPGWVAARRRDYGISASWSSRAGAARRILSDIAL